jgi:hypothetical protein
MAGNPKKRAERVAAKARQNELEIALAETMAAGGIPSAVTEDEAPPRTAVRPQRHLRAVASPPRTPSGTETRRVADHAAASEIAQLSVRLHPGLRVQIERTKPHWCAGIVEEDYVVSHGGVVEMLSHIREEWGGAAYRLTISQPNGAVAFESRVQIAAPPRHECAPITRASWLGEEPATRQAPAANPAPRAPEQPNPLELVREVFRLIGGMQQAPVVANLERLETMNERLVSALVTKNGQDVQVRQVPTLREQLEELADAHQAVERAGKMFGGARDDRKSDEDEDDVMQGALKEATKHFLGNALASQFGGGANARAGAHMGAGPRARGNPVVPAQKLQIPSAGIAGQKTPD